MHKKVGHLICSDVRVFGDFVGKWSGTAGGKNHTV